LLYKDKGQGGFIKIDERDFPAFGDGPRYVQFGFNLDNPPAGLIYVDNFVLSYRIVSVFSYENNFDSPSDPDPGTAWPELVDMSLGGPVEAANGRIEWTGSSNHWLRLDKPLPRDYTVEFDFFYQENISGRFSFWPLCGDNETDVWGRHHYFLRKNTHYFSFSDTIPSEGPCDLTLPLGSPPHRIRGEVTGDHIILLYKNKGQGGFIKIDERDFPAFGDGPRYVQFGFNLDNPPAGLIYIDNLVVRGLAADRVELNRDIQADTFEPSKPVSVSLLVGVTGSFPQVIISEVYPKGWRASEISDGGVDANGTITWTLKNLSAAKTLTYKATPPRLTLSRVAAFAGTFDSGEGAEPVGGETLISVVLPYLYREAIDYDFSGSPVNGKKYPIGHDYGVRYAQGMDGIPSDVWYERPGGLETPAIDTVFVFPAEADFYVDDPGGTHGGVYDFPTYRDEGEIGLEQGASDTHGSIGGIDPGDWFRYTFDLGAGDQVLIINMSFDTWRGSGDAYVDVYVDNKFKGEVVAPRTPDNEFNFFTIGPFTVSGGEHAIVVAFPPDVGNTPSDFGRMEVVTTKGIGAVTRELPASGMFRSGVPFKVTLTAAAKFGSYTPLIEETIPVGTTAANISDGGKLDGNAIFWELPATTTTKSVSYELTVPAGIETITISGYCHTGLPVAEPILGGTTLKREIVVPVRFWELY